VFKLFTLPPILDVMRIIGIFCRGILFVVARVNWPPLAHPGSAAVEMRPAP
jgi:hypothetical protein